MIKLVKKNFFLLLLLTGILFFFKETFISILLPIPSDTIVGLYHPFLDMYAKISPSGVPFKNFLITDPVRQIIPWKSLVVESISSGALPLWNPYEMAGKPLLANFQSGVFYPFNILLFLKPFFLSWTLFIILQAVLSGIFLFSYLKNLRLDSRASLFGAISFVFSGFSIAWLEWGNILHTALWLPLVLLSTDKIFEHSKEISNSKYQIVNIHIKNKKLLIWFLILLFASVSSFFAGHLQIFFYLSVFSVAYFIFRWLENKKIFNILYVFLIFIILFLILTSIQWVPTLQFIGLSARSIDQNPLSVEGWFIPWQQLVQFLVPDFFGNPATLNYWGVWNYAEFIGYIGVIGLLLAFCSILSKYKKETIFFFGAIIVSLLFSLPTLIAKLPFDLSIPFLSYAQPTRLIFIISFAFSILAAFGFDYLIAGKKLNRKVIIGTAVVFIALFLTAWVVVLGKIDLKIVAEDLMVAKRNLIFPSGILAIGVVLILGIIFIKETMARNLLIFLLLGLSFYDVYRFGTKFTPFTTPDYFYPKTSVINFLLKDKELFRIAASDLRILPPNFSTYYKISSIEGYDPLYLLSYAELIAASEREDHSIKPPYGFNRIITPHNINSKIIDLLNVKYVIALEELDSPKFKKVFQEGQTRVYENKNVLARAFFVEKTVVGDNKNSAIKMMFEQDLARVAIINKNDFGKQNFTVGNARITDYSANKIVVETSNEGDGFLILTDAYYPTWHVKINEKENTIYRADHVFRGIYVPAGRNTIVFYNSIF